LTSFSDLNSLKFNIFDVEALLGRELAMPIAALRIFEAYEFTMVDPFKLVLFLEAI
jgi:hypothetical protein